MCQKSSDNPPRMDDEPPVVTAFGFVFIGGKAEEMRPKPTVATGKLDDPRTRRRNK